MDRYDDDKSHACTCNDDATDALRRARVVSTFFPKRVLDKGSCRSIDGKNSVSMDKFVDVEPHIRVCAWGWWLKEGGCPKALVGDRGDGSSIVWESGCDCGYGYVCRRGDVNLS